MQHLVLPVQIVAKTDAMFTWFTCTISSTKVSNVQCSYGLPVLIDSRTASLVTRVMIRWAGIALATKT